MQLQLQYFVAVAETRHFTRAAETVHVAQPSLSQQIKALERELGADLFLRARGNITLTDAGEALLPLARRIPGRRGHGPATRCWSWCSCDAGGCGWAPRRVCAPGCCRTCCARSTTGIPASSS